MGFTQDHDLAPNIGVAPAFDSVSVIAGGSGDNVAATGLYIDRFALDTTLTAVLALRYKATLSAGATISFGYVIESSDDNAFTAPVTLLTQGSTVKDAGAAGGSTQRGVLKIGMDLAGAKQYVRARITPDLSAGNTDTAEVSGVFIFAGTRNTPIA